MDTPYEIQKKWRKNLFQICVLLAAIGFVTEVVIYLIDTSLHTLFLPDSLYRLRFIYIPSSLNIIIILITYICIKSDKLTNSSKNIWSCILILFLCINTQFIHYVYGPLLCLPSLAIFVSILFANKKLTICLTITSCISIIASCIFASTELRKNDPQLLSDMCLALLVMFVSYIAANLLIKYVNEQIMFIKDSSKRENELLHKLQLDTLMGIYNRRGMEQIMDDLLSSRTPDRKLCIVMLDLDHFKQVNDTYGHPCGDQVLVYLADLIREHGRKNIIPCRYGGEEIIIILKNMSIEQAYQKTFCLLENFRQKRFDFAPNIQLSFSAGIAEYKDLMSKEDWINQADKNLYQAKSNGRNCIYPDYDFSSRLTV